MYPHALVIDRDLQLSWSLGRSLPPISCCLLAVFSRVLLTMSSSSFRGSTVNGSSTIQSAREGERCACGGKWTARTFLVGFGYRPIREHPLPDDARRGRCTKERSLLGSAVPCITVFLHFYAAREPLIERRHMQLVSTLTRQIKSVWVNDAADGIWISTGGQHAQIGGRFYNHRESHFLDSVT